MKHYLPKIIYGMLAGCFGYIAFIGMYCFYLALAGTPNGVSQDTPSWFWSNVPMSMWLSLTLQGDWIFTVLGGFVGIIWALLDSNGDSKKPLRLNAAAANVPKIDEQKSVECG